LGSKQGLAVDHTSTVRNAYVIYVHCIVIFCAAGPYLARIAGSLAPYGDVTRVPSRDRDWHPSSTWRPYPGESTWQSSPYCTALGDGGEGKLSHMSLAVSPRRVPWRRRAWASAAQCCVASVVGPRRMPDCLFGGPIINGPAGAAGTLMHPIPVGWCGVLPTGKIVN